MSVQRWHPSAEYIIYSIIRHQEESNSYGSKVFDNKLFEYRRETNVYVYIDNYDLAFVKEWLKDEDAPLLDQNLDAIYNINFGTIYDTGIWNSKGEYLPEYTSLEENGRIITLPNWCIKFVISENHIIELEKGLENCINKGILNIDCCRIIMSFGVDFCRIM
jgi:hypothetical protein|tara:strand:+ start:185 stop:670 length:486 start_codon:yes stop_codon:yes gene_type:complete